MKPAQALTEALKLASAGHKVECKPHPDGSLLFTCNGLPFFCIFASDRHQITLINTGINVVLGQVHRKQDKPKP